VTHDRDLSASQPLAQRGIDGDTPDLVGVDKIVVLVAVYFRQAVLLDQLPDLCQARFLVGLLLSLAIQLLVACRLGLLRSPGGEFRLRGRSTLLLGQALASLLLLQMLPFGFPGLLFIDQPGLQQLIA
jgi:hypothetical protein